MFAKKSTNAINIISMISAIGMCFGTAALILILSVFNGFEELVLSLYDTFNPDFKVLPVEGKTFTPDAAQLAEIEKIEGVEGIALVLEEFALLQYKGKYEQCRLKGVNEDFLKISSIGDSSMVRGQFKLKSGSLPLAVVGYGVERNLAIDVFDDFEMMKVLLPKRKGKVKLNPENAFTSKPVKAIGTFAIQEEFDREYVFVPLDLVQEILDYENNEVSQLEIGLSDGTKGAAIQKRIQAILGNDFVVNNRFEQDVELYKVMKTEKFVIFLILTLILIVASFNIVGSLSMLVMEKKEDIVTLKSMGADRSLIQRIFLIEGFMLSFLGGLLGMIIAFFICFIQQNYGLVPLSGVSLLIDAYPVKMIWTDFAITLVTVILITLGASALPAYRAANQGEYK